MEGLEAKELWAKGLPWPFFHRERGRYLELFLILSCLQSYPKDRSKYKFSTENCSLIFTQGTCNGKRETDYIYIYTYTYTYTYTYNYTYTYTYTYLYLEREWSKKAKGYSRSENHVLKTTEYRYWQI